MTGCAEGIGEPYSGLRLALLSKEEAVGYPVFLALLHLSISRNRREWRPIAAMFGLSLLFGLRVLFMTAVT